MRHYRLGPDDDPYPHQWRKQIKVYRSCDKQWIDEEVAGDFVNIEEDFQGRDKLTFKCVRCGRNHTSLRVG